MTLTHSDLDAMSRALQLAERGLYTTTPNPRVGCVIVSENGDIVGEGFHLRAGEPHAEINALNMAGNHADGATVYVTLEPCNHHGRTGPCTEALISAGVQHVIYAMQDPNPKVAGQGLARLKEAGIKVSGPILEDEARAINPGFIKRMQSGRPYVRCKLAMSLDGRTAMASGESQWITGTSAREDVQRLRARSCSIITGAGTVLADNPSLTVRTPEAGINPRQPLRIVLDSRLRIPADAKITQPAGSTVIASSIHTEQHAGCPIWELPADNEAQPEVDLRKLLERLGTLEHNEVLIESGPTLAGAFLQAGLIDELVIYMAGKLMGSTGRPLFELPLKNLSEHIGLAINEIKHVGDDWRIIAQPNNTLDPIHTRP